MKNIITILIITISSFSFGQSLSDTIYFKSGVVRTAYIYKETKGSITYQYRSKNNRIKTAVARKSLINSYTIGDKQNSDVMDFTSKNQRSPGTNENINQNKTVRTIMATGAAIVFGGVATCATIVAVIFMDFWN